MLQENQYDVFISYSSENKPWVRVLAKNLKVNGFKVFFDEWSMIPGKSIARQLADALKCSNRAILIASPEAVESGWVNDEYEQMISLRHELSEFTIIPLIFGSVPDFPSLKNLLCIDFDDSSGKSYRESFYKVICGLKDKEPGNTVSFDSEPEIPGPNLPDYQESTTKQLKNAETVFLEEVFDCLNSNQPVILLAQAGHDKAAMHRAILQEANEQFSAENVWHLVPLGQTEVDESDYFNYLAIHCGASTPINSAIEFEFFLDARLSSGDPLFIMMTRLEVGDESHRVKLALTLRNLSGAYPGQLHLLFSGSEQLIALRFEAGNLSPLNTAEQLFWPEADIAEIQSLCAEKMELEDDTADQILQLSGGHPALIRKAIRLKLRQPQISLDRIEESLLQESNISTHFIKYRENLNEEETKTFCEWLHDGQLLGSYQHWPDNRLLRELFWKNLLVNRKGRFSWRCELIRSIGKKELGC